MSTRLRFFPRSARRRTAAALVGLLLGAGVVAQGCSTVIVLEPCEAGSTTCDGACVDLSSDDAHCGACDAPCKPGSTCVDATCVADTCAPPLSECGGACVNLQNDPQHCGGCFSPCDSFCSGGVCLDSCEPLAACFGSCVDTTKDPLHCGGCDQPCDTGEVCEGGVCISNVCEDGLCGVFCDWQSLPSDTSFSVSGSIPPGPGSFEPPCAVTQSGESAFFFVAPVGGTYVFDTVGSDTDTILAVSDGGCAPLACNDDTFELDAQVVIDLLEGAGAVIVVDSFGPGFFQLNGGLLVDCPPNLTECGGACVDTLSDPEHCGGCFSPCPGGCVMGSCEVDCLPSTCGTCGGEVDLASVTNQVFNGNLGDLANGHQPVCGVGGAGSEVAHRFLVPVSGTYTFAVMSDFSPTVTVTDAATCEDVFCFANGSGGVFLDAGEEVFFVVDSDGAPGPYSIVVQLSDAPACPTGDLGSAVPVTVTGTTVPGGVSSFTPSCVNSVAPDHTYLFTPPTTGVYRISTAGSSFDTVLHVRGGTCAGPSLACNDDFMGSLQGRVDVNLTAGAPVTIVVDGFSGAHTGNYQLSVTQLN